MGAPDPQPAPSPEGAPAPLGALEAEVLTRIQTGFPIAREPYAELARQVGSDEETVYRIVHDLRERGDIRRVGAVFDSAHLGYVSTLCALAVEDPEDVESAAAYVSSFAEVTHNYLREDRYNIWFTLIARSQERIDAILADIARTTGWHDILDLPALALYKIRVDFDLTGSGGSTASSPSGAAAAGALAAASAPVAASAPGAQMSPRERALATPHPPADRQAIVRLAQGSILGSRRPFAAMAERLAEAGVPLAEDEVIAQLRAWKDDGTIRRFGAVVRHRRLGFSYNAMSVWDIPDELAPTVGPIMASFRAVSHCYQRPRTPSWPANLYGMIHATTREGAWRCAEEIHERLRAEGIEVPPPRMLLSTREFKKRSMRYFEEEGL